MIQCKMCPSSSVLSRRSPERSLWLTLIARILLNPAFLQRQKGLEWPCPVRSALKMTPVQDFNSFSITFYYIISTIYQKIGDLFCSFIFLDFCTVCSQEISDNFAPSHLCLNLRAFEGRHYEGYLPIFCCVWF